MQCDCPDINNVLLCLIMTVIVVIASLYQMMSKMSGEGSCLGGKYDAATSHSADNKSSKIASETGDAAKKGQRQTLLLTWPRF
jgi:uncharacterized protein (UPF0333 family)